MKKAAGAIMKMKTSLLLLSVAILSVVKTDAKFSSLELRCTRGGMSYLSHYFGTRCCGGQPYFVGHQRAMDEHYEYCNVEPADPKQNLAESQWTLYKCLMERMLGGPFTLKSYAESMTGNMTAAEKQRILDIIEKIGDQSTTIANMEQLQRAWNVYFDAEYEVCQEVLQIREFMNSTEARRYYWDPSSTCGKRLVPFGFAPFFSPRTSFDDVENCMEKFETKYNLPEKTRRDGAGVCMTLTNGLIKESDLRGELDFDNLVASIFPKYLPADTKTRAMTNAKEGLMVAYPSANGTTTWSEMLNKALADPKNQLPSTMSEEDRTFYSNAIALDILWYMIAYRGPEKICYPAED